AVKLLKETSTTKFDSTVEVHMKLGIDPTQADQIIRSTVALPHGTGKEVRVVAFVDDSNAKAALDAGAVKAGDTELIAEIEKGWLEFDVAVAEPSMMSKLGKVARTLGQKGLMPNPKAGTVTPDFAKAISELKKGKVEFRNDKQSNLHNAVGKVSFTEDQLKENLKTYIKAIITARPPGAKGNFIKNVTFATTMGPGICVDITPFL
ncbi:MAG: 50S ribosomal protein L1, partial [Candidatus Peregrinibacteria bacterium]|nr:50S ribosomal protein L1 [Candidatus Peregrinibacteria bacterium]